MVNIRIIHNLVYLIIILFYNTPSLMILSTITLKNSEIRKNLEILANSDILEFSKIFSGLDSTWFHLSDIEFPTFSDSLHYILILFSWWTDNVNNVYNKLINEYRSLASFTPLLDCYSSGQLANNSWNRSYRVCRCFSKLQATYKKYPENQGIDTILLVWTQQFVLFTPLAKYRVTN